MVRPELVLLNGNLITVDRNFSRARAAAVARGRFTAVGADSEIKPLIGGDTRVVDLEGRTVIPGIVDSHCHPGSYGAYRPPLALDVGHNAAGSMAGIAALVAREAARLAPGSWIYGRGWDLGVLAETLADPQRRPTRDDLDPVSPEHPVALVDFSGHNMWVNSLALELAGITDQGPETEGGEIVRDPETGRPTGMLLEWGGRGLVDRVVPLFDRAQKKQALLSAIAAFNAYGITSLTDAAVGPGGETLARGLWSAETLDIYAEMSQGGELNARINVLLLLGRNGCVRLADVVEGLKDWTPPRGLDPDWVRQAGIKVFADGVPITKTAWMHEEYVGGGRGSLVLPGQTPAQKTAELQAIIAQAHAKGLQVGVHATGDAAIDAAVEGFLKAQAESPGRDRRHYIIHGDFISAATARKLAQNNLGLTMQPRIKTLISDQEEGVVGEARAAYEWPMRTVLEAGVVLGASSDAPVQQPDWRKGIASAVLREADGSGRVSGPKERIGAAQALTAYTLGSAWLEHAEGQKGSLEPGKLADMCILDRNILAIEPREIPQARVLATLVGGRAVHESEEGWGKES